MLGVSFPMLGVVFGPIFLFFSLAVGAKIIGFMKHGCFIEHIQSSSHLFMRLPWMTFFPDYSFHAVFYVCFTDYSTAFNQIALGFNILFSTICLPRLFSISLPTSSSDIPPSNIKSPPLENFFHLKNRFFKWKFRHNVAFCQTVGWARDSQAIICVLSLSKCSLSEAGIFQEPHVFKSSCLVMEGHLCCQKPRTYIAINYDKSHISHNQCYWILSK